MYKSNIFQLLVVSVLAFLTLSMVNEINKSGEPSNISTSLPVPRCLTFSVNNNSYVISCLTQKDVTELYRVTMQEKENLRKTLPWLDFIQKEEDTKKFIEECEKLMNTGDSIRMGIRDSSGIIGILSIDAINSEKPVIGYWLCKNREGRGIVTTALSKLTQEVFKKTHVKNLYICVEPSNHKSKAIAKRLNFSYEGRIKNAENMYGTLVDQEIFLKKNLELFQFHTPISPKA